MALVLKTAQYEGLLLYQEAAMSSIPIHHCECSRCQGNKPHLDRAYHAQINLFLSHLNEPQRRWFAALEAIHLGHGGRKLMAQITGMSPMTIRRGCRELETGLVDCPQHAQRAAGGGRPTAQSHDPALETTLEAILAAETAGDPMGHRRRAKRSSLRALSARLCAAGHPASRDTVAKLLRKMGYSPKANARRAEARSVPAEQRSAQFDHITAQRAQFAAAGDPVISVDTKKKN
jgi:hypothetical protein